VNSAKWFGRSWGAPFCGHAEHAETPVGSRCFRCNRPIEIGDQGVLMAHLAETVEDKPWHLDCFLGAILPGPSTSRGQA
jgi:hypothetical protein